MLELGIKVVLSYLAGSLNGALLVGWLHGGVDIRKQGSGNAGGTNALRTQGKVFALLVMIVDVGKGILPVLFLPAMDLGTAGMSTAGTATAGAGAAVSHEWLVYACAAAAIFGHCYPVWFEFVGGKGAATAMGVMAVVAPVIIMPALLTWLATLFLFGYVGLATVLTAFSVPVWVAVSVGTAQADLLIFTFTVAVFIAFTHRSNLRALIAGGATPDIRISLLHRLR